MKIPKPRCRNPLALVLIALTLLPAACAWPPTPVNYYQLSGVRDEPVAGAAAIDGRVIGIGPVLLPERLDRQQIITRMDANRLQLSDSHRWIEPLAKNISQVLRENLSNLLATEQFHYYPWSKNATVDLQLLVDVVRFEGEGYKTAHLETIWSIQDAAGKTLLTQQRSGYRIETPTQDPKGLVNALSGTLTLFSRELARQLVVVATEYPLPGGHRQ
jgi:hypothetical protein